MLQDRGLSASCVQVSIFFRPCVYLNGKKRKITCSKKYRVDHKAVLKMTQVGSENMRTLTIHRHQRTSCYNWFRWQHKSGDISRTVYRHKLSVKGGGKRFRKGNGNWRTGTTNDVGLKCGCTVGHEGLVGMWSVCYCCLLVCFALFCFCLFVLFVSAVDYWNRERAHDKANGWTHCWLCCHSETCSVTVGTLLVLEEYFSLCIGICFGRLVFFMYRSVYICAYLDQSILVVHMCFVLAE